MSELYRAADSLNEVAPPGERLAYVNPAEESLLKAVGGSGQESSGGVPSYKKGDVEAPPAREYGAEMASTLRAQRESMAGTGAFADLGPMVNMEFDRMTGRPAFARGEQEMLAYGLTGQRGLGEQGLLSLYEEHVAPSIMRQQEAAAAGEIDMLREMGPQFMEAQRAADPESEKIRQMLQTRAQEGLAAGQDLTQEELAGVSESVRSGQSARGEAFQRSQPAMIEETLARLGAGRQAEAQRIQRAQSVLQQTSAVDPFLALTGRTARMPGQVAGQLGTAGFALQSGPQLYNPESQYAGALASQNQANVMNARMATSANQAAMTGGLIRGSGALGGGMFTGAGAAAAGGGSMLGGF